VIDLLIGHGEVGRALAEILGERRTLGIHDPPRGLHWTAAQADANGGVDWLHIAYPWHKEFLETTLSYWLQFRPRHVVIHSTVPVGTTSRIVRSLEQPEAKNSITFSPIRGIHPHLGRYLREFPKWYAASDAEGRSVESYFQSCGLQTRRAPSSEILEYMKLLETTEYGYRIALWQDIERQNARYEVRGGANESESLTAIKEWLFEKRKVYDGDRGLAPIMFGGVVGGHCVTQNWELLRQSGALSPQLYRWLKESNEMRKGEIGE